MQFIDLASQYRRIKEKVDARIGAVLDSSAYIMGEEVDELENELAVYTNRKYCLSCSSGTSALVIPLMAIGLKKSDAIFVPSFTFFATAEVVGLVGATPVFVDSDETYNIAPEALEKAIVQTIEEGKLTPRGIIPVDIFGLPANYEAIEGIAKKYNLFVLSDAAQSFGAERDGKKACSFGDVAATSFFPAKPLGCYGDGGAVFTDDEDLYEIMKSIRFHGQGTTKYDNVRIGINGRLDTLQAAVLLEKMKILDDERRVKNEIATRYSEKLKEYYSVPVIPDHCETAWAQYTMLTRNANHRQDIIEHMKAIDIPLMVYYNLTKHMQKAFSHMGYAPSDLPISEDYSYKAVSLPMHAYLSDEEVDMICDELIHMA